MADTEQSELVNTLEFVDEKERLYFAQAQLSHQTQEFLRGPVGRYMHGRAKQLLAECQEEALKCNGYSFFGRRKLKKLQDKAAVARQFITWCVEIIAEGELAARELENYRG